MCCKTLWSPWNVTLSHDFPRTGLDAQHLVLCLYSIAERRIPWWRLRASLGKTLSLSLLLSLSALPSSHFPTKSSESPPLLSQSARAATAKCQRLSTLNNRILFLAVLETKEAKFKLSGENAPHGSKIPAICSLPGNKAVGLSFWSCEAHWWELYSLKCCIFR